MLAELSVNPLTLDCARARQLLDAHYDGELEGEDAEFVEAHLEACTECRRASSDLKEALAALSSLSPADIERLRSGVGEVELDTRPFAQLVFGALLLLIVAVGGATLVALKARRASAPAATNPAVSFPLPTVGGEVGVEALAQAVVQAPPEPAEEPGSASVARVAPSPNVVPQEALLAALPPVGPAAVAPAPKPMAVKGKKAKAPVPEPVVVVKPDPLPAATINFLERLRFSQGLGYRGITFFFVQDPEGRDRLPAQKNATLPQVFEERKSLPTGVVVRPPKGRKASVLLGELLDAPLGLRIASNSERVSSRASVGCVAVAWDAMQRGKRETILSAPVLAPTQARLALIEDAQPGPVAILLSQLTHNAFSETQRLRLELNRLESEARQLERRLRARIRGTRGLRGVAITLGGGAKWIDLFSSSRDVAEVFPKLIRSALLEMHLAGSFGPDDESVDWASTNILGGQNTTRDAHRVLLRLMGQSRKSTIKAPSRKLDAIYQTEDAPEAGSARLSLAGKKVFHGVAIARVGSR
jgi:hypothetical protein